MKINKIIPFISTCSLGAILAPTILTSCSSYSSISLKNGYTPKKSKKESTQFQSIEEANLYYATISKDYMIQDFLWSAGEYFKERMEFPSPILPFKFIDIDQVTVSIESWWTNIDKSNPSHFISSFSWNYIICGTTEPREANIATPNGYIINSYATIKLAITATKLPLTLEDTLINSTQSNTTDARWIVKPCKDDVLSKDSNWNVSATATATYTKQNSYDEAITSQDVLGVYWYKDNLYDETRDYPKSYLFPFVHDSLIFGSYHLQDCETK